MHKNRIEGAAEQDKRAGESLGGCHNVGDGTAFRHPDRELARAVGPRLVARQGHCRASTLPDRLVATNGAVQRAEQDSRCRLAYGDDPATFSSGRQFAAWLGLVTRQTGTGGRVRQLGLSKRGNVYLRTLLMHAVRAIIARSQHSPWIEELLKRRPYSVAVAALANKLARTIWAVLFHHTPFDPEHSSGPSI